MVEEAHVEVTQLLAENRAKLDSLTRALLKAETLDAPEAYAAAEIRTQARDSEPATALGRPA